MRLPGLDVIFGLAAPAIDILIKDAGVAALQVRDDEACVGPVRASLDAGSDTLDAAPAFGAVEELLEAAHLAILRRSFEAFDMAAQRRGRSHAQDVIEALGPTPVENLGTAIVTVGAQQNLGVGPIGADRSQKTAQEGPALLAARPFGGAKNGGDEATRAVEHDDRLKTIFVVVRIEQTQLLTARNRVEGVVVVEVEREPLVNLVEGFTIKFEHGAAYAHQVASIGQVFQSRDGRLGTQFEI